MSKQPRDDGNAAIPVLGFRYQGAQRIAISATSTLSTAFAANVRVISIYADADCYFEIGDHTISADVLTSHFLPAGTYLDVSLGSSLVSSDNAKHIAVIGTSGMLHVSERT